MPNTQTSVPAFTAGQVLTAQQQTEINTGIPVFATTTTRDAAFGGTGEKVLAEGQFAYIEASNTTQYYDGAAWQTVGGGLALVKTQTIGTAVSSVTVTNAFSSTYENYKIIISGGAASTGLELRLQLGASTTGYYSSFIGGNYASTTSTIVSTSNGSNSCVGIGSADGLTGTMDIAGPQLAQKTYFSGGLPYMTTTGTGYVVGGYHNVAAAYTDFTILTSTGTITGGTIRVYGYQNS